MLTFPLNSIIIIAHDQHGVKQDTILSTPLFQLISQFEKFTLILGWKYMACTWICGQLHLVQPVLQKLSLTTGSCMPSKWLMFSDSLLLVTFPSLTAPLSAHYCTCNLPAIPVAQYRTFFFLHR